MENILQNFNLFSFTLGMAVMLICTALGKIIGSYVLLVRSRKKVKEAEAELARLKGLLAEKSQQIREVIEKKEKESGGPSINK